MANILERPHCGIEPGQEQPAFVAWLERNSLGIGIGLLSMVGAMLFVFFEPSATAGSHVWLLSGRGDLWVQWITAGELPNRGGYADIFSLNHLLKTPPGWELLISPIAHRFAAWPNPENFPGLSHPKAIWIAGPTELLAVPFTLCAMDVWLRRFCAPLRRRVAVLTVLAVLLPPASLWGHPEDLMALGCGLLSLRAVRDDRWSAGWWMGAALGFQIEAVLLLPLCLVLTRRRRIAFLLESLAVPMAVLAVPLIAMPHVTIHALLHQTVFRGGIRYTPIHRLSANSATVDDVVCLLVACAIAGWVWLRRDRVNDRLIFWLVGVIYSLRLLYPSLYPYYVIPALAVFCAAGAMARAPRFTLTLLLGVAMTWWVQYSPVNGGWLAWMSVGYPILVMALLSHPPRAIDSPHPPAIGTNDHAYQLQAFPGGVST
jgi:hypothetical protein